MGNGGFEEWRDEGRKDGVLVEYETEQKGEVAFAGVCYLLIV